ncbi:MAG: VOC family protein [Hyphomonadaceae bacterium]
MAEASPGNTPRRPGVLAVHSLDHFQFAVPDLAQAARFYTTFGLDVQEEAEALALRTAGSGHVWGRVSEGPRKKLNLVSFAAYAEDVPRFEAHLARIGVARVDPPKGFESNGIWVRDPDGVLIEVRAGEKTSPDAKAPVDPYGGDAGVRNAPNRSAAARVHPRRFAHMLNFTTEVDKAIAFYSGVLGLRLSDRSGDGIAFLHGAHGSDHHMIAFVKSNAPGLHHVSWDVPSIDEIGRGANYMREHGYARGWGLGRHVLGSNFFHYVRDPWGGYSEYSSDIDYIPVTADWRAADHPAEDSFYIWGPDPPEDFAVNYEAGG